MIQYTFTATQLPAVPMQAYDPTQIQMGPAIFLVGILALLALVAIQLRNPAALVTWAVTVLLLVFSGLFGLGFEWVWLSVAGTVVLLVIGAVARWGDL